MTQNNISSSGIAPPVMLREAARPAPANSADFMALLDAIPLQASLPNKTDATGSQPNSGITALRTAANADPSTYLSPGAAPVDDLLAEPVVDPGYALVMLPLEILRLPAEAQVVARADGPADMPADVPLAQPQMAANIFAPAKFSSPTVGDTAPMPQLSDLTSLPVSPLLFGGPLIDLPNLQVGGAQLQKTAGISQDQATKFTTEVLAPGQRQKPLMAATPDSQVVATSLEHTVAPIETKQARPAAGQHKYPLLNSARPDLLAKDVAPSMPTQSIVSERVKPDIGNGIAAPADLSIAHLDRQWPAERPVPAFPFAKEAAYRHGAASASIGFDPVVTPHVQDLGPTDLKSDSGRLPTQATLVANHEEPGLPTVVLSAASTSVFPLPDLASLPQSADLQPQQSDGILTSAVGFTSKEAAFAVPPVEIARPNVTPPVSIADLPRVLTVAARADQPHSMSLQLDPVELGSLAFNMEQGPTGLVVNIVAERPETIDLLRRHADQFLADLRQSGFQGVNLQFSQSDNSGSQRQPSQQMMADNTQPIEYPIEKTAPSLPTHRQSSAVGLDLRL